jgi:hypothetical protein
MNMKAYLALLLLSLLAGTAGLLTLLPHGGASYPNILGYKSLCTFAPAASLFCFFIAGVSCLIRASLIKRKSLYGRASVKLASVAIVGLTLALALASTAWFMSVKAQYPPQEGTSAATELPAQ